MGIDIALYKDIVDPGDLMVIEKLAGLLRGKSFIHVNATASGGGVAELLQQMVPLIRGLGIDMKWKVMKGNKAFFDVTKNMHNTLQGKGKAFTKKMWEVYEEVNYRNTKRLDLEGDCVVIHDPQPAAMIKSKKTGIWIWRCHIDVSTPDKIAWYFLKKFVDKYDASIFSVASFAQSLTNPQFLIPPSIDPLAEKNIDLDEDYINKTLERFSIPRDKPILLQVSRFDPWKDPVGVIEAYRMVKKYKDCRLVLAGGTADDDPEGAKVLEEVEAVANGDPDIHLLLLPPSSHREINALQRAADVIIQKSLREGFGLVVAEALWKGKPVIGSAVGGIPLQIIDRVSGFLVHSKEGTAYRIRQLLHNPAMAKRMGELGKEHIKKNFLVTRHIKDYLALWVTMENKGKEVIYL